MAGVKTYDPLTVQCIVGSNPMSGFADGTYINIEPIEDAFNVVDGADGEVSRSKTSNRGAMLTITLKQTSASNDILSALYNLDQAGEDGGVVPFMLKEGGSGRTIISAQACFITRMTTVSYSKDVEDREWSLRLVDVNWFVGGNASSGASA